MKTFTGIMEALTPKQQKLYNWVVNFIRTHEYSPTVKEMMKGVGFHSQSVFYENLGNLRAKGYIDWVDGRARSIQILRLPTRGIPILGEVD